VISGEPLCFSLASLPCILYEGSNFVHEKISRAGKIQKSLNRYVHVNPYHTLVAVWVFLSLLSPS